MSNPPAEDQGDWKHEDDPRWQCKHCGSSNVWYRARDSDCGGFTDYKYQCRSCNRTWWAEGADA